MNVIVDVPAAHWRGKVDVKFQQVFRERFGGGIDLLHDGRGVRGAGWQLKNRRAEPAGCAFRWKFCWIKSRAIFEPWFEWKLWRKAKHTSVHRIVSDHCRQPDISEQISLLCVNGEELLPLRKSPIYFLQFFESGRTNA